jgi:hypothetical protein
LGVPKTGSTSRIPALSPLVIQHKALGAGGKEQGLDEFAVEIAETLAQGASAFDDQDFSDELTVIKQWFGVLWEA